ncbi:MAG: DUF4249 domain-containing protein [Bacteroidota bacterium]
MRARTDYIIFLFCGILCCASCIEEIEFENEIFESALVIDATITNEDKKQEIFLSRTYPFEDGGPNPESNATVNVIGNAKVYEFNEVDTGSYVSQIPFKAEPNVDYQLQINTSDGRTYISNAKQLTSITQINDLYAVRETNDDGANGMSIYIDTFDPTGNSKFYRYEYEETFRVEPPVFVSQDLVIDTAPGELADPCPDCQLKFEFRSQDKRICYRTETSKNINLINSADFTEDRVTRFLTRFVRSDDYRISHRYSILVKQFVHSSEAYNYLEAVSRFSGEGSLFSQVQPGFVTGNIVAQNNIGEKVLGYFDVTSVSTKRIFFNYEEFYPNQPLPPYINSCELKAPLRCVQENNTSFRCGGLVNGIRRNIIVYRGPNNGQIPLGGAHLMVDRECGDCTALGDPEPPDFWIE